MFRDGFFTGLQIIIAAINAMATEASTSEGK